MIYRLLFFMSLVLGSCQKGNVALFEEESRSNLIYQAISLTGDSLFSTIDSTEHKAKINELNSARNSYEEDPSIENMIWVGRREAYLGRYDLAISTFSDAIAKYPESYEALRHRGHRYITIREFDKAILDFKRASKLMESDGLITEIDGMPNHQNIPLSTVQFNVWYHLGLAYYLKEDFDKALAAYAECLEVSDNDDLKVASVDWMYMTLMKLGRDGEAEELLEQISEDMSIIENDAYHKRLLMYKGILDPDELIDADFDSENGGLQFVTQGYGLGNYYLNRNEVQLATENFLKVMKTNQWAAFGYIASEMELARLKNE